ncbi:MAG: stage II sporulation protein M [Bacteroidetes bacterium]|nr:stage II sporulation protein M [Bacteroidota bacterium]
MKEARFIKLNKERWTELEQMLQSPKRKSPDEWADMYVELSDDLAFSQTFYPDSNTTGYLNQLAIRFHNRIYRNKKEDRGRFLRYWLEEIPESFYRARWPMLIALLAFLLSVLIGAASTMLDQDFVRLILGDGYVDMTIRNIERGDPMAVYAGGEESAMFGMITLNNIMVALMTFVLGYLGPYFPIAMLIRNGIMLGAFQAFFYQYDSLGISAQAIWIHGTIEITSIVVAGGAGIELSKGFLFPGTYTRMERFKQTAKDGMKMALGLIPFFIIAGFLESFATRHYKTTALSIPLIIISIGLISWYFIYLPYMKHKDEHTEPAP